MRSAIVLCMMLTLLIWGCGGKEQVQGPEVPQPTEAPQVRGMGASFVPTAGAQVSPVFSLPEAEREYLLNRVRAHFLPQTLPVDSPHRLDHAVCGTPALMGLLQYGHALGVEVRQKTAVLLQRPTHLPESVLSPSGHFRIHFTRTGSDAVADVDADGNGIPDYVDESARTFDAAWDLQINQMGYRPPPSDGDGVYDVYIKNLGLVGAYGFTYAIAWPANVTPSFIEIDNNYTDVIYQTRGLNGLRVTAAHEFFHAVQFGYYANFGAAWWQEMTAVWMEDVAYPEINDYYQYLTCSTGLHCFFDTPELSLDRFAGYKPFGGAVYAHHLSKVYGASSVRHVWEELHRVNPASYDLGHIDRGMPLGGFAQVLPRFSAWNYLTGSRARSGYYPSAADYPLVKHPTINLSSGGSLSGSARVDYLGATYIPVRTSNMAGGLRAAFTLSTGGEWTLMVMLLSPGKVELLWPGSTTVVIPNVSRFQEVVFVPMVRSLTGTQLLASYALSSSTAHTTATDLVGDFTGDGRVDLQILLRLRKGSGARIQTINTMSGWI